MMAEPFRRRYFFFDYDGTLAVPRTYDVPPSTRRCLHQLEEAGHFIALATGRLQCNAMGYMESVGISNVVADGGHSVTVDGRLVWMEPLELEPVKACLRKLDAAGIPWAVTTANELRRYTNNPEFDRISGDYYVPTVLDEDMTIDSLTSVYKAYIPAKKGEELALERAGFLDGVPWVRYTSDTVFIEPLDKARGIRRLLDILGAPYEDAVVFGDGRNDISMFVPPWTCIAMGNGVEELKARASYVTDTCENDGIVKACQHFGWIS